MPTNRVASMITAKGAKNIATGTAPTIISGKNVQAKA
jgi:hypothetical protein